MSKQLFYYSAPWCQPCETLGPIMDQVNKQIPVRKINIDYADPAVITEAQVRNIPTVLVFKNGEVVARQVGVAPKQTYADSLNTLL